MTHLEYAQRLVFRPATQHDLPPGRGKNVPEADQTRRGKEQGLANYCVYICTGRCDRALLNGAETLPSAHAGIVFASQWIISLGGGTTFVWACEPGGTGTPTHTEKADPTKYKALR